MSFLKANRVLALLGLLLLLLAACTGTDEKNPEERQTDAYGEQIERINESVEKIQNSRQIPVFDYSVEWDTLVDVLIMRAEGTHGTALVTNLDGSLKWWCPTEGAPVPSTYQSTPEEQYVDIPGDNSRSKFPVSLAEPTGVVVGDSAATWVKCLDDNGNVFVKYDESNVEWTSGVVENLPTDKRAKVDEITFEFTDSSEGED